jgi:hypothetical protein
MAFQRVPRPPNAGRKKGSLNKLTIGRMEAAIAVEHPEYTTLQKLRAVATIIIDRLEHTKRYTEAEGRRHHGGWQDYAVANGSGVHKLNPGAAPVSPALGRPISRSPV